MLRYKHQGLVVKRPRHQRDAQHCSRHSQIATSAYNNIHQASVSLKGRVSKRENEDRVVEISSSGFPFLSLKQPTWASVFDGHQGSYAASMAAKRIHSVTQSSKKWQALTKSGISLEEVADIGLELFGGSYSLVDEEIRKAGKKDGTTALVACFIAAGPYLLLANAGDSRAVLCRNDEAVRLTTDHNLTRNLGERRRVSSRGGMVMEDAQGVHRVMLSSQGQGEGGRGGLLLKGLSTSRGLGDAEYKEKGIDIISDPDVTTVELQDGEDAFVICASDGLWTFVPDQEAVDLVNERLRGKGVSKGIAKAAADELAALALSRGSEDDVSIVVSLIEW